MIAFHGCTHSLFNNREISIDDVFFFFFFSFSYLQSLLFPPSLYDFVTSKCQRDIILVFNKIDLVPASVLAAWKGYFEKLFPKLKVSVYNK